jgi:tripartite-type tricarboxylate transporter receptor subunit TctC
LRRSRFLAVLAAAMLTCAAYAQSAWPNRPVKVIVPFPAGGVTDVSARIILDRMGQALGSPLLVENRPGAGTKLGTAAAIKSPKDGYTLYMNNSSYSMLPVLDPEAGYDAERDLVPVGLGTSYGMAVAVNAASPHKSLRELVSAAKQNPGKLSYGSAGMGSGSHFMGEHLKKLAGVDMLHVPFKSTSVATQEVAAGRVDLAFEGAIKPFVDSGKVKVIAVTGTTRDPRFPQIPTVAEAGMPEFTFESWLGLFAPVGTPEAIITRLNQAMNEAVADPGVKQKLADLGLTATGGPPAKLRAQIATDLAHYRKIASDTGVKLQ